MGYSMEVVRRARERLAQARSDRERENREHLRIAYEQQPRLREIDRQLRMTMASAARAAFAGGEAVKMMEQGTSTGRSLLIWPGWWSLCSRPQAIRSGFPVHTT